MAKSKRSTRVWQIDYLGLSARTTDAELVETALHGEEFERTNARYQLVDLLERVPAHHRIDAFDKGLTITRVSTPQHP